MQIFLTLRGYFKGLLVFFLSLSVLAFNGVAADESHGRAEHVVILVWDGMRPDFITPQITPNLCKMIKEGVYFNHHHPQYPSTTEVNGTAIATGMYPGHSGVVANAEYLPELSFLSPVATEGFENLRRADLITGGHYLRCSTLAEILQQAGYPTIITGTKTVALLHDRLPRNRTGAQSQSPVLFAGQTLPKGLIKDLETANGGKKFPSTNSAPNTAKDAWTTKALINGLWKNGVPKYTLMWLYDPDSTQHAKGVGSSAAVAGIENSDHSLMVVLNELEKRNLRDKTDVFVASDHGFSNIKRGPDVADILKKAGFKATRKFEDPEPGEVMVVGLGGTSAIYVVNHDEEVISKLVQFLQGTDFAGVIFTRKAMEGTFPMDLVHVDKGESGPDIFVSMRWFDEKDGNGTPGVVVSDSGTKGKGTHGSLSRFDMHNILIAAGPDFKKGFVDELPTASIDLAPTVLWIFNVAPPKPQDGRVLLEAMVNDKGGIVAEARKLEASRDLGKVRWTQHLNVSRVGNTDYFDEGNGEAVTK